jgi:hypothetical protein
MHASAIICSTTSETETNALMQIKQKGTLPEILWEIPQPSSTLACASNQSGRNIAMQR